MRVIDILGYYNYWGFVILLSIGLYGALACENLFKKMVGLGIFQTAIFLLFISIADIGTFETLGLKSGTAPIIWEELHGYRYVNPVPHVLVLTGIVVSAATLALGLALMIRIYRDYGTLNEEELRWKL